MTDTGADKALRRAREALAESPVLATYLARGASVEQSDVSSVDFTAEIAETVIRDVRDHLADLAQRELIAYDPAYQPSGAQALVAPLASVPELGRLHQLVRGGEVPLDSRTDVPVRVMAHRVHDGPADAVVYRLTGAGIATRRAQGIRILLPRDGIYEEVPREVLFYQPTFDATVVEDVAIFASRQTIENRLHASEQAKSRARATLRRATARIRIQAIDDLEKACTANPAMVAKMASLATTLDSDPEYEQLLTTENLLRFLDAHPHIPIRTDGDGENRVLVFEPAASTRYLIPKLLSDDFLQSDLSHRDYEVGSKRRLAEP